MIVKCKCEVAADRFKKQPVFEPISFSKHFCFVKVYDYLPQISFFCVLCVLYFKGSNFRVFLSYHFFHVLQRLLFKDQRDATCHDYCIYNMKNRLSMVQMCWVFLSDNSSRIFLPPFTLAFSKLITDVLE